MNGMTDVSEAKKGLRKAGRQILNCGTSENQQEYKRPRQVKCSLVTEKKSLYYKKRIEDCDSDIRSCLKQSISF